MKKLKVLIVLFFTLIVNNQILVGQDTSENKKEYTTTYISSIFEGSVSILDPIFNFGDEIDGIRLAISSGFYFPLSEDDQIYLGFIAYYSMIDRDVQLNVTNFGEDVNDIANSNMLGLDLGMRYYPDIYFLNLEPYLETNLGARSFYTVTKAFFPDTDETVDRETSEFNMALAYGFALGTHVFVSDVTAINLKVNFQFSNIARYYAESEDNRDSAVPLENFDLETSQTDFIRYDLGASYFF